MVTSPEEWKKKKKDMSNLSKYFLKGANEKYLGQLSYTAKFYLAYCMACRAEYTQALKLLKEVADNKAALKSRDAERFIKEIKENTGQK